MKTEFYALMAKIAIDECKLGLCYYALRH